MAPKTTSGSGFHFIVVIYVADLVHNATNLENVHPWLKNVHPWLFQEIWPQSWKIQKLFKRVTWVYDLPIFDILWKLGPSTIVPKFSPFRVSLNFFGPFTFFGLSFYSRWFSDKILCTQLWSSISPDRYAAGSWNLHRLLHVRSTIARYRNIAVAARLGGKGAPENWKSWNFKN